MTEQQIDYIKGNGMEPDNVRRVMEFYYQIPVGEMKSLNLVRVVVDNIRLRTANASLSRELCECRKASK